MDSQCLEKNIINEGVYVLDIWNKEENIRHRRNVSMLDECLMPSVKHKEIQLHGCLLFKE